MGCPRMYDPCAVHVQPTNDVASSTKTTAEELAAGSVDTIFGQQSIVPSISEQGSKRELVLGIA